MPAQAATRHLLVQDLPQPFRNERHKGVEQTKRLIQRERENLSGLVAALCEIGGRGWQIKRFKGLGEMNPDELWHTTMNPETRTLQRVEISEDPGDPEQLDADLREGDRIFSILMGDDVESRRNFIETNAIHVKNLDI